MNMPQGKSAINPRKLAQDYDRFISARWRGEDETADSFASWIEAHWTGQAPLEPDDPPEGASILGNSGAGIRWYARGGYVFGYASPGSQGCYRIAATETAPSLTAPWDQEPGLRPGSDRVLQQAPVRGAESRVVDGERTFAVHGSLFQDETAEGQFSEP